MVLADDPEYPVCEKCGYLEAECECEIDKNTCSCGKTVYPHWCKVFNVVLLYETPVLAGRGQFMLFWDYLEIEKVIIDEEI